MQSTDQFGPSLLALEMGRGSSCLLGSHANWSPWAFLSAATAASAAVYLLRCSFLLSLYLLGGGGNLAFVCVCRSLSVGGLRVTGPGRADSVKQN